MSLPETAIIKPKTHSFPQEVETVRAIIEDQRARFLLLQKAKDSKAPGLYEFPGGKIDRIRGEYATLREQIEALIDEVWEETGILLPEYKGIEITKASEFTYKFEADQQEFRRRVHQFQIVLPVRKPSVLLNQTLNPSGELEDKHTKYRWVTKKELEKLERKNQLSRNSHIFLDLL